MHTDAPPIWATLLPKSYPAPFEVSFALLSYAAPFWAMLHPIWATLLPKSYPAPFLAKLHPSELCCILLSCGAFWCTLSELLCTLWATLHPSSNFQSWRKLLLLPPEIFEYRHLYFFLVMLPLLIISCNRTISTVCNADFKFVVPRCLYKCYIITLHSLVLQFNHLPFWSFSYLRTFIRIHWYTVPPTFQFTVWEDGFDYIIFLILIKIHCTFSIEIRIFIQEN